MARVEGAATTEYLWMRPRLRRERQKGPGHELGADIHQHDFAVDFLFGIGPQTTEFVAFSEARHPSQWWMVLVIKMIKQKQRHGVALDAFVGGVQHRFVVSGANRGAAVAGVALHGAVVRHAR